MKSLEKHLYEIYSGGWPVIHWKSLALLERLATLISGLWAIPAVLLIRCLHPWRIIRFGPISTSRIGDFAIEASQKWAMTQRQSKIYLDLYWFKHKPVCNEFWARVVQRNFHVSALIRPLDMWNQILPGGALHHLSIHDPSFRDIHGYYEQNAVRMEFLPEEDTWAKSWLHQQGWQEGDPFVCLLVRDSSYLDNTYPNTDPSHGLGIHYDPKLGYGWNHLNYRDSDIATYVPAMEWLANQGVWVLRMGKIMANPIPSNHTHIIDYAFDPDKSDFLDIWLFAHCDLCISTGTGIDTISDSYRKPILFLNFMPLREMFSWSNAMHLPKNLIWNASGTPLNLREQFNDFGEYYDRNGIRIINLAPEEILEAVQERWQRIQGTWIDTEEDLKRNSRFWEILKTLPDFYQNHGWIHPEARVGAIWLRSKGDDYLK
jgi:putative glycosyltransferase (TIGR04372 family)